MADFTVTTDVDTFMQSADKAAMRTNMDLGTAATKDVAATGDAASGEVVKGDDTRLTDARTPTSHTHTASEVTDFDTEVANNTTVAANTSKLAGIEAGAEVNNISDVNATDLTDGGDSTLHYHATDRARSNHTGTQTLSTISDAGTAASKDVPATGDAAAGEVVLGNDSRLTDARTPTSHTHTASEITDFDTEVANNTTVAANTSKLAGIEAGAEVNNISDVNATDLTDGGDSTLHYHSADRNRSNHTGTQTASTISDFDTEVANNTTVAANTSKLAGIEAGAEVNNISDANATDLTDGGDSSLHYHSADRSRSNHTGTQTLSTISDAGTIASQNSNSVNITGGSVTGITDLAIADGGTGAGTASGARTNLDVYSTGEVDEYLAPKATAGGVRFDGVAGDILTDFQYQIDSSFTFSITFAPTSAGYFWEFSRNTGTTGRALELEIQSNGIARVWFFDASSNVKYSIDGINFLDGEIRTLTVTVSGTTFGFYVNGSSVSTTYGGGSFTGFVSGLYRFSMGSRRAISVSTYCGGACTGSSLFNRTLSATEVATLYRNGLAGIADADRWGVPGTSTGCIAAYPMDEGIGYQIHDISSNHYDGLLSTSGFTHLLPKTEGYIRDFNVDAYNGGSGIIQLLTSTQDILPDDCVISRASFINQGTGAVSGTLYIYRISSGGASDQIYAVTLAMSGGAGLYMNTFPINGVEQIETYKEMGIRSFDVDATNLDVRLEYKILK